DTGRFHLINLVYTLMNPSAAIEPPDGLKVEADFGQVISYAHAKGVGVAVYSPLAGGLLSDVGVSGGEPHPLTGAARRAGGQLQTRRQQAAAQAGAFRFLSVAGRHTLAQAAVRFILMEPGVTTVLGGFSDTDQLEEITAASGAGPLGEDLMRRVESAWRANLSPDNPVTA